jgi:hypothetical protein
MELRQKILLLDRPSLVPKYRNRLQRQVDSYDDAEL